MDARANFGKVTVNQGYDASATSIVVSGSDPNLSRLPDPSTDGAYNVVWWDSTTYPDPSDDPNVEIVRVTGKSSNTLTIQRAQETTAATTKNTAGSTYKLSLSLTAKFADDLDAASIDVGEETRYVTEITSSGGVGAKGDGTTNDTTPIQDHLTNGNLVVFPPGTYIVDALTIHSNMTIMGAGPGATTVKLRSSSGANTIFTGTSVANVLFQDLTIDGNKSNNGSALDGILVSSSSDITLRNVEIKNCKRHGINLGANSCQIQGSRFTSCDSSGAYVDGDNNVIHACRIASNGVGITVNTGADDTLIDACYFTSNTTKVTNSGTNTHARCNVGWKTCAVLQTATFAADSTGVKSEALTHGLDVTPTRDKCNLSMRWETATDPTAYANIRGPFVADVSSTEVKVGWQNSVAGDAGVNYRIVCWVDVLP